MASELATQIITPEQLAAMPNDNDFELVDGQLVERKMGNKANWIATQLARLLGNYVSDRKLGWLFTAEAGYRLAHNTVRKPDVSFIRFGRLPNEVPADAYDRLAPDLAVEVISPTDIAAELDEKVDEYIDAGVRLVWVIHASVRRVDVHRPGRAPTVLQSGDELDGEDVIPGFRCLVADLFEMPRP